MFCKGTHVKCSYMKLRISVLLEPNLLTLTSCLSFSENEFRMQIELSHEAHVSDEIRLYVITVHVPF